MLRSLLNPVFEKVTADSVSTDDLATNVGAGSTVSRSFGTFYQNTTGQDIRLTIIFRNETGTTGNIVVNLYVAPTQDSNFPSDLASAFILTSVGDGDRVELSTTVSDGHYYYIESGNSNDASIEHVIRRLV